LAVGFAKGRQDRDSWLFGSSILLSIVLRSSTSQDPTAVVITSTKSSPSSIESMSLKTWPLAK